eukprot:COSAG02_NODE_588_length_19902_cov_115.928900_2_plen_170_part_00
MYVPRSLRCLASTKLARTIIANRCTIASLAVAAGGNAQSSGPGQRARKLDEATGEDGFKSKFSAPRAAVLQAPHEPCAHGRGGAARSREGQLGPEDPHHEGTPSQGYDAEGAGHKNVRETAGRQPVRERRGDTQQPGAWQDGENPGRQAQGCAWACRREEEEEEVNGVR